VKSMEGGYLVIKKPLPGIDARVYGDPPDSRKPTSTLPGV